MTLKEKYELAASSNKELLSKVLEYIINTNSTNIESIINDTKYNIKLILKEISLNNKKALLIRKERAKVRDDLDDLERAYCQASAYDGIAQGKNTGGKPNNVEIRQIEKANLRERLGELLNESQLLEKTLFDNNELMKSFINLLPQKQYSQVLEMTHFECMSNTTIACELGYSMEFVNTARIRGLEGLTQILKKYLNDSKK